MEEHRTVAPWCIANQIKYVEAPRREDGLAPLHIAAEQNKRRLVSRILELRACPDVVDNQGRSPLMVAALHGFTEIMVSLVKHGASHCVSDAFGRQALHYAAQGGENVGAAIDILIDAKADVDARDLRGATPLMGGASVQSSIAVDKLLLHGAGVFQVDYVGQRALHHARLGLKGEKSYRCWHEMGENDVEQSLFCEERRLREVTTPGLARADRVRIYVGLPKLPGGTSSQPARQAIPPM
jgi:ankyrin repeat protein